MRLRHMRHERASEEEKVRKDWILERFNAEGDDWLVNSR